MPLELLRWSIAERFGWRMEEVDSLSWHDLTELLQIDDARNRARSKRG